LIEDAVTGATRVPGPVNRREHGFLFFIMEPSKKTTRQSETDHVQLICDLSELSWTFSDSESLDAFLDRVVTMVSRHMRTGVSSVYLYDDNDGMLVLRATCGLVPESVGRVRLRLGEGITGLALKELRPIAVKSASSHPSYRHFRGIDEERYDAFLAVPILRGIHRIGVLVAQRTPREPFSEMDSRVLQAVSSQLANILENARLLISLSSRRHRRHAEKKPALPDFIKGHGVSLGFAHGEAVVINRARSFDELMHRRYEPGYSHSDFTAAIEATRMQLEQLQEEVGERLSDAASLICTSHLLVLKDREFTGKMHSLVERGTNPPEAVMKVGKQLVGTLSSLDNPYLAGKADDVRDLVLRIMRNLLASQETIAGYADRIVVAAELYPSDLLRLSGEKILGIVLVTGGATSHLSILARALGIPLVFADVPALVGLQDGTPLLIDAEQGTIYLRPSAPVIASYTSSERLRQQVEKKADDVVRRTSTADGTMVRLLANINLLSELKSLPGLPAEGIGLYRTEFPFLIRSDFPTEEEQYTVYRKLVEAVAPGSEVTFRTLDIGGDKVLSYFEGFRENNPFLGMRSIRFSLSNRSIFLQQIRAVLRAGAKADLKIMFPMISSLDEFLEAREIVRECIRSLAAEGEEHNSRPRLGIMIELPSVLETIDDLAREVEFFSLGTNDFIQYMLAVDRTNEKVAALYNPHHPAVLRGMHRIAKAAIAAKREVSVCGEMAHQEHSLPVLIGLGYRIFSVDPVYLLRTQRSIARIDTGAAEALARDLLAESSVAGVEKLLSRSPLIRH
jgi:phosphotransferase system enzyme I (PtsP)